MSTVISAAYSCTSNGFPLSCSLRSLSTRILLLAFSWPRNDLSTFRWKAGAISFLCALQVSPDEHHKRLSFDLALDLPELMSKPFPNHGWNMRYSGDLSRVNRSRKGTRQDIFWCGKEIAHAFSYEFAKRNNNYKNGRKILFRASCNKQMLTLRTPEKFSIGIAIGFNRVQCRSFFITWVVSMLYIIFLDIVNSTWISLVFPFYPTPLQK
ncbi:hypothetical protein PR048_027798 [Dryococelus australis]|uniref:Uncharacterized protein n=1 Tax=Dryococelus australis TaxID=614101 RepID=A0ABQ9GHJ6_9NEOP|nr:hypothetical protein PR048_027798 [Dryococelus australis]